MRVGAAFALADPKRSAVLLRSHGTSTARAHPLNKGLVEDIDAACTTGLLRPEARASGVLYWLGLCQILMVNLVERRPDVANARLRVREMITLGLAGLGVDAARAATLAEQAAARLGGGAGLIPPHQDQLVTFMQATPARHQPAADRMGLSARSAQPVNLHRADRGGNDRRAQRLQFRLTPGQLLPQVIRALRIGRCGELDGLDHAA